MKLLITSVLVYGCIAMLNTSCHSRKNISYADTAHIYVPAYTDSIYFEGGNGTSKKDAVIIRGADNSMEGVPAEYYYIKYVQKKKGIGYQINRQVLLLDSIKVYDRIDITQTKGGKRSYYFDITEFYGKF